MKIRKLHKKDVPTAVNIVRKTMERFCDKEARFDMRYSLDFGKITPYKFEKFYVAEIDKKIVGVIGIWSLKWESGRICNLDWFAVDLKYQEHGIGTALLNYVFKVLKRLRVRYLFVKTNDSKPYKKTIIFYKNHGFKQILKFPGYWENGDGLIYFVKKL